MPMTESLSQVQHARLFNCMTEYDRAQARRKLGYNRHALGHYARALGDVQRHCEAGHPLRAAIISCFLGPLCDRMLRSVGLEEMTDAEARHGLAVKLPHLD